MIEILSERTYTRKVYDLGGQVRRGEFHAGHIHYLDDTTGALADVDLTWEDAGTHWAMTRASYRLRVAKDFSAPDLIRYGSRFEGATHDVLYEPHSLVWATGRDVASVQPFRAQQAVQGVLVGSTIRYPDAFGPGIDFEVTLQRSGFTKELVIRRRSALEAPPSAAHRLVLLTRYRGIGLSGTAIKDHTGTTWTAGETFESPGDAGFSLHEPGGHHSLIRPAYIEDASDRPRQSVPMIWLSRNGALWQAKVLPTAYLTSATYPVRADTVTSYYAGAGDGWIDHNGSATWSTIHDAATGTSADATGTTLRVQSGIFSGFVNIRRGFFPVDTSGIPDGDTITAATFYAYPSALSGNGDNDGDDWFNIVGPTSQASNTTLGTADYDQCGAISSPTELSDDRKDYSTFSTGAYSSWALNATGLSNISKTSYTLIGLREGHDCLNSAYAGADNTSNQLRFHSSEATGTANDPYLAVTYSTPSTSVSPRLTLLGVGF